MQAASQFYKLGLIGYPVSHSLSPLMHRAAISFCGLEGTYDLLPLSANELQRGFRELVAKGYTGFNVTVPHKQAIMPMVSELTAQALRVRAVNTITVREGAKTIVGHNTDLEGFIRAVQPLLVSLAGNLHRSRACVLGGGGAARAAVWGLIDLGFGEIDLLARNRAQAEEIVLEVVETCMSQEAQSKSVLNIRDLDADVFQTDYSLIVNSTRIGLGDAELPQWLVRLISAQSQAAENELRLFDMVYAGAGRTTALVTFARSRGAQAMDGLEMLIEQAASAFEFWTGQQISTGVLRNAIDSQEKIGC